MHEYSSEGRSSGIALPELIRALQDLEVPADDAVCVDQIRLLEQVKSAAAAAQAKVTAGFVASQRTAQREAGVPEARCERGIAAQVGLAMRTSPHRARKYVGWSRILTTELPETFARLQAGDTTEWRAMLVARESAWLSREHRAILDRELAPRLEQLGDKQTESETKTIAYRLDPEGYVARLSNADAERGVSLRPAPDVMARLSALLPVREGVASIAALTREADARRAAGDPRSRRQLMADILVERITGVTTADAIPVEVNLTIAADTLLAPDGAESEPERGAGRDEPAYLHGYGPIPAPLARDWLLNPDRTAQTWLRRLYTRPDDGQLIGMDSRRRLFPAAMARFLRVRDQACRTPWCGAPIRHSDHIVPADSGGPTSIWNGQGLCQACNYAKQAPGWRARPGPAGVITTTTPTGHHYWSRPPAPPGSPPERSSPLERHVAERLAELLHAA